MNKKLYNEDLANIFKKEVLNESDYDQFSVQPDDDGIDRITSSTPEYPEDEIGSKQTLIDFINRMEEHQKRGNLIPQDFDKLQVLVSNFRKEMLGGK